MDTTERYQEYKKDHCWQYDIRKNNYLEDLALSGLTEEEAQALRTTDFIFEYVPSDEKDTCKEIVTFIKRHEWLGKMPLRPTHRFTMRYKGMLAGVVVMAIPNAVSKLMGDSINIQNSEEPIINYEKLISRGACISWSPKNLASTMIMQTIKWMVKNTDFRLFTCYGDEEAKEIGQIYQACNFYYLGKKSGSKKMYYDPLNPSTGWFSDRVFRKLGKYKKYAKDLGLVWQSNWDNGKWSVQWQNMGPGIEAQLRQAAKDYQALCDERVVPLKHKYAYVLGATPKETKRLRKEFTDRNKIKKYIKRPTCNTM